MLFDLFLNGHSKNNGLSKGSVEDRISRSIAKKVSWRLVGTLDTVMIAYFITGTFAQALSIGLIEWGTKVLLYFFHERLWNKISWDRSKDSKL